MSAGKTVALMSAEWRHEFTAGVGGVGFLLGVTTNNGGVNKERPAEAGQKLRIDR